MVRGWAVRLNVWLFLALVALTPLSIAYLWREPVAISYINVFSVVVLVLGIINFLTGHLRFERVSSRSLIILIALMALMLLWGSFFSVPTRSILGPWTSRFLQPLLVGYLGYVFIRQNHLTLTLDKLAGALWVSLGLVSSLGFLQLLNIFESNNPTRLTGLYLFPNSFARYLEALLLLLAPFLILRARKSQIGLMAVWVLGLVILLGTNSYAGIGSFIVGMILIFLFLPRSFRSAKIIALGIIAGCLVLTVIMRENLPKYQATITSSLTARQQFWQVAWETIKDHPSTGIGLGGWERTYYERALKILPVAPLETVSAQPHNIYLDALLRAGVLGLIAVVYLLVWPIVQGVRLSRERLGIDRASIWLPLGAIGYGAAMMIFGLVDDPIFSDDVILLLFVVYFSLASTEQKTKKDSG